MPGYRREKLNKLIRLELGKIISKELEFDGELVTLTLVEVDRGLETAIVWYSVFPTDKEDIVYNIFQKRQPWLQHLLGEKIKMRQLPKLVFRLDKGIEKAAQVEKKLLIQ